MDIKTFEQESARTMTPNIFPDSLSPVTLHGIIGIASESGELLDAAKKAYFYGHKPDKANMREEIGDIMWYLMAVCREEQWDIEEIMGGNIDKLRKRYPEQFTKEHSAMRLDKIKDGGA